MGLNEKETGQIVNSGLSEGGDISANSSQIKSLSTQTENITPQQVDLVQEIPTLSNGWILSDGTIGNTSDGNWNYTDFFEVELYQYDVIQADMFGFNNGSVVFGMITFYDDAKNFISSVTAPIEGDGESRLTENVAIPQDAVYSRLCYGTQNILEDTGSEAIALKAGSAKIVAVVEDGSTLETFYKYTNQKISLEGDSISSTDYQWYKEYMEIKTGATVYNRGQSGATTSTIASNFYFTRITDDPADVSIFLVGGNDSGVSGSVGTFDANSPNGLDGESVVTETDISIDYNGTKFVQAVSHIIRKYQDLYYNFRENANLTGSETEVEKKTKLDAVQKPKIIFATTLPQKRNDSGDSFSQEANWLRKVNAVKECCEKYDIPCVDLYEDIKWDMEKEPYWVGPTDKTTNNGIYTMDGLHPNEYGYIDIVNKLLPELRKTSTSNLK